MNFITALFFIIAILTALFLWGLTYQIKKNIRKRQEADKQLIEDLSDYAHEAWSGWMKYLFEKGTKNPDGTFTMNADSVERWERQMNTSYAALSENEKESDRIEARKMF